MKESIYIWNNLVWYKEIVWSYIVILDIDNNVIIDNISDLDVYDDYYIKNEEWKLVKWKGLLRLYKGDTENIYSFDESKIIFDKWYKYIKVVKIWYYKVIYNYIVSNEENKYNLSDMKGNIISKSYDDIFLWDSIFNSTLTITLGDEFNFISPKWREVSEIWFDDIENFTYNEFTKVIKGESINYINKQWKFLTSIWFDELIHLNEWYAIVKVDNKEFVVWDYWEFEYEKKIFDNKYFQNEIVYDDYEKDEEFIVLLVYLDYYMSKSYVWPHEWMEDFTLWFNNIWNIISVLVFILDNYKLYKNTFSFINGKAFENNYHNSYVWRREALVSSAIYYLIESDQKFKEKYDSNKYYNLCLVYMDSFFKDLLQWYKEQWVWKSWENKFEWWQEIYILWEKMYDVVYWKNIYLSYWEWEWTPFCTWWYLDCLKK